MTYRSAWILCFVVTAAPLAGCSSSSSGTPFEAPDASSGGASPDASGSEAEDAEAAAPAALCDAASLAPVADAALASCFQCQSAMCASLLTACSTDCLCAPAYACLQQMSNMGSLNTGYMSCQAAVAALTDGNVALMNLQGCATIMCNAPCFGDGG
jgi:hypothetical protein